MKGETRQGAAVTPAISVVIPTYGNARGLPLLCERLVSSLQAIGRPFEVIFVDDRSPDDSWRVLQELRGHDERIVLIRLMRNAGQQRAVLCGLDVARGDVVVTMDDDLQHRPEEIPTLLGALEESGADAVIGRFPDRRHGLLRKLGSWFVKRLAKWTLGVPTDLTLTSFRIIRGNVAREMSRLYNPSPVVGFLLFQVTPNIVNVPVSHDDRATGTSTYSWRALLTYFSQMVLDYSELPLRAVGLLGSGVALLSFCLGIYYLVRYFTATIAVAGWATLVLMLTFFSGLILMTLGIIGIYLGRILRSVNAPTQYVIGERIGSDLSSLDVR